MISRARYIQRSKLRALNATFTASLPQLQQDTEPRRAANVQARGTAASWLPQLCTLNSLHYSIPVSLCVCSLLLTLSRCLSICISILLYLARSSLSHSLSPPLSICLSISLSLSLSLSTQACPVSLHTSLYLAYFFIFNPLTFVDLVSLPLLLLLLS